MRERKKRPLNFILDELDALPPKREELGGEKQVEDGWWPTAGLMDGLESRGQVIIGANLPNLLDPALRRPAL